MSSFYTNVLQFGNSIYIRGVKNGKRFSSKESFKPTLYVKTHKESKFKTMFGEALEPVEFGDINDAKEFTTTYKDVSDFPIFGNTSYNYQYIADKYPTDISFDPTLIKAFAFDLEVASEEGFPDPDEAKEEILLITVIDMRTKRKITFGSKSFDVSKTQHINTKNYEYIKCKNEIDLLQTFLQFWKAEAPDVITGWYTPMFDIPYLINRAKNILPHNSHLDFSPWRMIHDRTITLNGREHLTFDIVGIAILDMLDLYKKFGAYNVQESYSLDYIADQELGRKKLENPYESLREFYTKDWPLFVEYNVIDTELVDELEDKMKLIELVMFMAYGAKCNYVDLFSPVRTWDCILYNHMKDKNIVPHQGKESTHQQIEGGYVKDVVPGRYDWVVSFDATSLYPSIIMQWNMSPETLYERRTNITVKEMLEEVEIPPTLSDLSLAANGHFFTRKAQGLFPEVVEKIFAERIFYKKKMVEAQKEYEKTKEKSLLSDISAFNNRQLASKILLNALYGATANRFFRFYDTRIAEGITKTGQFIIQRVGNALNDYMNKTMKTDKDYVIAQDTDSCYLELGDVVRKYFEGKDTNTIVGAIDKMCNEKIQIVINSACNDLAKYTNAFQRKIFFKREAIAESGIWVAKKRYALSVWDSEGVRYSEPKIKVTGLETKRSSTPKVVRESLTKALNICLTGSETQLQEFISDFEKEFSGYSAEQVAFPRGVNGIIKYGSNQSIYTKGTPMHVRGALLYNHLISEKKLDKKYEYIREGDKIKFLYLKEPNSIGENCIAFLSVLPKQFDLHKYVDYKMQFQKTFLDPLTTIINTLSWETEPQASLDSLFD
jgi:DNA polymerase elongation subunit (family B)